MVNFGQIAVKLWLMLVNVGQFLVLKVLGLRSRS